MYLNSTISRVSSSIICGEKKNTVVICRNAVYERGNVSNDSNIVREDRFGDVHPDGVSLEGDFENLLWAEDDLWTFSV